MTAGDGRTVRTVRLLAPFEKHRRENLADMMAGRYRFGPGDPLQPLGDALVASTVLRFVGGDPGELRARARALQEEADGWRPKVAGVWAVEHARRGLDAQAADLELRAHHSKRALEALDRAGWTWNPDLQDATRQPRDGGGRPAHLMGEAVGALVDTFPREFRGSTGEYDERYRFSVAFGLAMFYSEDMLDTAPRGRLDTLIRSHLQRRNG